MPGTRSSDRRQHGFTLVEVVIAIVVMGILAAVGSSMISDTFKTARIVDASQGSADQARYAMERLAREIREVKAVGGSYSIGTMGPTTMVFTRTINGADVTVTIAKSGNNLTLGYSSPAVTSNLATQVTGFALDFLKLDNTATVSAADVRFVVITLTVTDATSGQVMQEKTRIALRNA